MNHHFPLFDRYPALAATIGRIPILTGPSPVQQLEKLRRPAGVPAPWIKRDDLDAIPYGGNKPRKLEFLLAEARKRGAKRVVTIGGTGSNHCLATCLHARKAGLEAELLLVAQPVTDHVRMSLRLYSRHAARMDLMPSYGAAFAEADRRSADPTAYVIPIGGSNAIGTLGFVNAALELADQVSEGLLPGPARVLVAAGTCGTLAGLILGLAMAGLRSRVIGVRVVDTAVTNTRTILGLIEGARALMVGAVPGIEELRFSESDFDIIDDQFGAGYGHPTPAGLEAIRRFREEEGIPLEPTYTGKTVAALLEMLERPGTPGPLLYWHTFAGPVLEQEARSIPDSEVPADFRTFLADTA